MPGFEMDTHRTCCFCTFHLGIMSFFFFSILRHLIPQMIWGRHIEVGFIIFALIRIEIVSVIIIIIVDLTCISDFVLFVYC